MESSDGVVRRRASGWSALFGVTTTLVMSTAVFVAFLIVPVIVLGLAFLLYFFWPGSRPGKKRPSAPASPDVTDGQSDAELPAYRFGTGG